MYDLIYLDNRDDYTRAQGEIKQRFPKARLGDASDSIHLNRFTVEISIPTEKYRLEILDLGLALHSLNFQLLMMAEPAQAKSLVEKWKVRMKEKPDDR